MTTIWNVVGITASSTALDSSSKMKNLKVFGQRETPVNVDNPYSISVEEWSGAMFLASKNSLMVFSNDDTTRVHQTDPKWGDAICCYSLDQGLACLASEFGLFVWHYTDDTIVEEFECPGRIKCAAFSPDGTTVAFASDDQCVTLLDTSLEPIGTVSLDQEGYGKAAPVALGWGKKETQFHGSAGKEAALGKSNDTACKKSIHDDDRYELVWRDDGEYFVVSWPDVSAGNQRRLRVFTQTGELHSTSELVDYMEIGLCWRPRVQLILGIQRRPQRGLDVIFFETNAQRHGEFELLDQQLEPEFRVQQMRFDAQGDVLAVLCVPTEAGVQSRAPFIRLITCSNYQWSVKRELTYPSVTENTVSTSPLKFPIALSWSSAAANAGGTCTFHVVSGSIKTLKGSLETRVFSYNLYTTYDTSYCMASIQTDAADTPTISEPPGLVAVVDHNTVQLSAARLAVIPPPMCSTRLTITLSSSKSPTNGVPCNIASISFPSPWVTSNNNKLDKQVFPMLMQINNPGDATGVLCIVGLSCGDVPLERRGTFTSGMYKMEAEWKMGARATVPWPVNMQVLRLSTSSDHGTPSITEAIDGSKAELTPSYHGTTDFNHFCWLNPTQLIVTASEGRLVGLLQFDSTDTTSCEMHQPVKWLLKIKMESADKHPSVHPKPPRVCGLCLSPDGLLCVQLSTGRVVVYCLQRLLETPVCHPIAWAIDEDQPIDLIPSVESDSIDPLHCVLQLPVACEQLGVARFTPRIPANKPTMGPNNACCPTRTILLGLHLTSHQLFGAPIPELSDTSPMDLKPRSAMTLTDLCSSFLVLPGHVLVTSLRKLLFCLPTRMDAIVLADQEAWLMQLVSRLSVPAQLQMPNQTMVKSWYNDYLHPIETGALLLTAIPSDTKVILQLPRGNLEEIHPRALVLTRLTDLLDAASYTEALILMRRHRVNLNLLHDHNPTLFRKNLHQLVHQVKPIELLTLFISDLLAEDVSETIYHTFYASISNDEHRTREWTVAPEDANVASKVNVVCDVLLQCMGDDKSFLLPVLTCYAKKVPAQFSNALVLLKTFRASGDDVSWESGIRYLQYFATPSELYRHALGTYDLELAELMAQRTQLDPKEYLAELNELRQLVSRAHAGEGVPHQDREEELAYQRFRIDDQLMRFTLALKHLRAAGEAYTDELIAYTRQHKLFGQALELFQPGSPEFKEISLAWAEHLLSEQKLALAGQVYLRGGMFPEAARAFLSATQVQLWSIAIAEAREVTGSGDVHSLTEGEIRIQALKLAVRLQDLGRYEEAVQVYLDFRKDPEQAIIAALKGGLWLESRRLSSLYAKPELMLEKLPPALTEATTVLMERLHTTRSEFTELSGRLQELRRVHKVQAETDRIAQLYGNFDPAPDSMTESEMFSETSSISDSESIGRLSIRSNVTRTTGRSEKSRRKKEARKWSSKPNSKYEEVGLMKDLFVSIDLGQRLANEASGLLIELWRVGFTSDGLRLLTITNQLLTDQKRAIPLIWDEWITETAVLETHPRHDGRKRYPFKGNS